MNKPIQQYPLCDRETAIKNLGGMVWLYEKHLMKFKNTYAGSADAAHEYILRGQREDARILIHSVKGLAGTLGLRRLYYAAAELELAITSADPAVAGALIIYDKCLNETLTLSEKD